MASPTRASYPGDPYEPFSNLEVAPTDHAADAPEFHDHAHAAPERDFSVTSPEVDQNPNQWPLGAVSVRHQRPQEKVRIDC